MTQQHIFADAKWIGSSDWTELSFSIIRRYFDITDYSQVILDILGLGFLKCYIYVHCINPDTFLPLACEYDAISEPKDEL